MPIYDYLCDLCGHRFEEVFSIHEDSSITPCRSCASRGEHKPARKIITRFPGITHGMVREAHYNTSTGTVIKSDSEFKSELSRQSDAASERNGFAVSFQPIDHRESRDHLGVTDEGLDSTYARQVETGQRETVKHF